ncbi:MAG: zinc-binding dehydrogenase [Candidatus Kapabacteria bacterium]|nr:zinc-binding dehydrogenase [Candidatus Kapabacteria bacterium]MDW8224424.1 zinc-binding dehydrogenase [Bacteroidota bacterium]
MRALVLREQSFEIEAVALDALQAGEARVRLLAAALNRRDEWIRRGQYPRIQYPAILGSDGCGIVEAVGSEADREWIGKVVVINPSFGWGTNSRAQGRDYEILGMPRAGTLAEYLHVAVDRLYEKPVHLSSEEAAALPLAGLTAYRALFTQGQLQSRQKLLITGIGGGVATMALQFAVAVGAQVFVTSGRPEKIERAQALGAVGGVNYRHAEWERLLRELADGEFDLVVDGTGGEPFNALLNLTVPGGVLVVYGATLGAVPNLHLHRIFWRQLHVVGSTMGTDEEFAAMLRFVGEHRVVPVIDSVFPFDRVLEAFERLCSEDHMGKVVVRISEEY